MSLNIKDLKEKYKDIAPNEKVLNNILSEVVFGFSEIKNFIENKNIKSVLEIGAGPGILLHELKQAYPHIKMVGLEPLRSGYLRFKKIKKIDGENLTIINQGIEEFKTQEKFDLIFSVNALEHIPNWETYFETTQKILNANSSNVILCPNYDFPYESHYIIPIIFNKKITKFFFNKYIKKHDIENDIVGHWESINFISKKKLKKFMIKKNYNFYFDDSIKNRILNRILYDKALKKRQGIMGYIAIISKYLFLDKIFFDILKVPFPFLKLIIKN